MTQMMKRCFVTLVILFLGRVKEGAEACSCDHPDPQQAVCTSDVVIRANVTKRQEVEHDSFKSSKYSIKVKKMFKGPSWDFDAVYSPQSSGLCGVFLHIGKQYLITGRLEADGTVHIMLCNFIKPWGSLSATQLSLVHHYKHYCS